MYKMHLSRPIKSQKCVYSLRFWKCVCVKTGTEAGLGVLDELYSAKPAISAE